jgi:hypothetical protein
MNPFDIKRRIEACHDLADKYGFELRENPGSYGYPFGPIYLFAKADNEVFSKEMVLNQFDSWDELMFFFQGYEKADMAWRIGGKKK